VFWLTPFSPDSADEPPDVFERVQEALRGAAGDAGLARGRRRAAAALAGVTVE
jgi:hypothetical protein